MKSSTFDGATTHWPFGLFQSLAIFAINLFGPIPAEAVNSVSDWIAARISCAISDPERFK
jgi:hypothetical protein